LLCQQTISHNYWVTCSSCNSSKPFSIMPELTVRVVISANQCLQRRAISLGCYTAIACNDWDIFFSCYTNKQSPAMMELPTWVLIPANYPMWKLSYNDSFSLTRWKCQHWIS
jgi:hypothetical protein